MVRIRAYAAAAVLLSAGVALAADTPGPTGVAASVVDRCYTVWATTSDADLKRLDETLRRALRTQASASEAQVDSAEAEIALLESRLMHLNGELGLEVADAAAEKTTGTPTKSASILGQEILQQGVAGNTAAQIASTEAELADAQSQLADTRLQQLRLPALESGLTRCIDYHRARMASAAAAPPPAPAPVPAPAPAPAPAAAPPPAPAPAPAPAPMAAPAPAPAPAKAAEPAPPPEPAKTAQGAVPAGWDGHLEGWYWGDCVAPGNKRYTFRSPLTFDVDYRGPIEGVVFWTLPAQVAHDGIVSGTTGHDVSGLMNADGTMVVAVDWQGALLFEGAIDDTGSGKGAMSWERDYESCKGTWAAD